MGIYVFHHVSSILSLFFPTRSTGSRNHGSGNLGREPSPGGFVGSSQRKFDSTLFHCPQGRRGVVLLDFLVGNFFSWGEKVVGIWQGWLFQHIFLIALGNHKKNTVAKVVFSHLFCGLQPWIRIFRRITEQKKPPIHMFTFFDAFISDSGGFGEMLKKCF